MPVESPPLPKTRKGRERREQLLAAATRAFAVHGFRRVTLAAVAAEVGITEQGAMHYFPTKEHLLIGVLEDRDARETEKWTRLLTQQPGLGLLDAIGSILAHNVEQEPHLATLYTVLMAEGVDPDHAAHDWFARRNRRVRDLLAGGVAAEQERGRIRDDLEPADVATGIVAMFDGLALQWSLDAERVDAVAGMRAYLRALAPR